MYSYKDNIERRLLQYIFISNYKSVMMNKFKIMLFMLSLAIVLSSISALPVRERRGTNSTQNLTANDDDDELTSNFADLARNLQEIRVYSYIATHKLTIVNSHVYMHAC